MPSKPARRFLAVDVGGKRTGLALGDTLTRMAMPIEVLHVPRGPGLLDAIAKAVQQHGPDAIVMGLPLNMDGSEGPAVQQAEDLVELLRGQRGRGVARGVVVPLRRAAGALAAHGVQDGGDAGHLD